jgi:ABC-type Fe3+/spermidine/putrescine transport system ATPase subunit
MRGIEKHDQGLLDTTSVKAIEIKDACKKFGKNKVIENLNLNLPKGEMFVCF